MTAPSGPGADTAPAAAGDRTRHAVARALQLANLGRLGEAVPLVQQVLATEPENVSALHVLAYILQRAGRYAEMLAVARQAAALAPDDPTTHRQLARAWQGLGRAREAVAAAGEAHRLDPEDFRNDVVLADALLAAGGTRNIVAAGAATHRARQLAPDEVDAHLAEGDVQRRMAEFGRAGRAYRHGLALEPDNPRALYKLATLDSDRGRALRASPLLGGTLQAAPTDPTALTAATYGARRALWLLTDAATVLLLVAAIFTGNWRSEQAGPAGVAVGVLAVLVGVGGTGWFLRWRLGRLAGPTRTLIRRNLRRPTFLLAGVRLVGVALGGLLLAVDPAPGEESGLDAAAIVLIMVPFLLLVLRARNWLLNEAYYLLRRLWFRARTG
ncbi:hypothetical protein O7627_05735 [Solwaraspora sp. WMMD1047]|uniref:tetratricopeptide repeat protein n=1 Tax=Solwaraspora sp. WMMD1047 TaxID=3016102 RepID=UPI002415C6BE|nr:tetratricopeptide repeat protein [Solwaraspora sp. WMMD1047]MDG4828807.1 hypothetical protein [Solwaraspora sp. WMMD1047]